MKLLFSSSMLAIYTTVLLLPSAVAFSTLPEAIRRQGCSSSVFQLASDMNIPPEQQQQPSSPECQRIHAMVSSSKLLMFMNGSQVRPGCKESDDATKCLERVCGAGTLRKNGTSRDENLFEMVDVTSDRNIRKGLQEYNPNWDVSRPQLYANGQFVGGSDTMFKMFYDNDFKRLVDAMEA